DSPLLRVNTPRSDEHRLKFMELMIFLPQKGEYGDITRLQALVDKKKIVISEAVIREILQLNDAKGVICLPNEEIFAGLAQMGYEKPLVRNVDSSSKFYMYPCFIQLIIQAQVGDLSTHTTRYISPALTQKVFANMRRVGKGFSGVETPLFEGMIADRQPVKEELGAEQVQVDANVVAATILEDVAEDVAHVATPSPPPQGISSPSQEPFSSPQQPHVTPQAPTQGEAFPVTFQQVLDTCSALLRHVKHLEHDNVAQSAASTTIPAASATISAAAPTVVAAYTRKRKGVIIRDPEEELSLKTSKTPVETPKVKDKGKGIMVEAPKPMKKKDQIEMDAEYARKL
nr:hypothetical protein [Tanacetum cinerariifolium]